MEELAQGAPLAGKAAVGPFDLILVADCVYVPGLYEDLKATITALGALLGDVLVAFEQRRRDISPFFRQFDAPDAAPFEACASFSEKWASKKQHQRRPSGDALQPTPSQLGAAEAKKEETACQYRPSPAPATKQATKCGAIMSAMTQDGSFAVRG